MHEVLALTQITDNTVVQFHYTLTDTDDTQIETNLDTDPIAYLHGHGSMIPAIEAALEGKSSGDTLPLTLTPRGGIRLAPGRPTTARATPPSAGLAQRRTQLVTGHGRPGTE